MLIKWDAPHKKDYRGLTVDLHQTARTADQLWILKARCWFFINSLLNVVCLWASQPQLHFKNSWVTEQMAAFQIISENLSISCPRGGKKWRAGRHTPQWVLTCFNSVTTENLIQEFIKKLLKVIQFNFQFMAVLRERDTALRRGTVYSYKNIRTFMSSLGPVKWAEMENNSVFVF